jgi:predicted nucleic acid-binding protein
MLECRVRPLRENQAPLLAAYDAFFSMGHIIVCELDASVIERATQLRAAYGFRTPDAIHLATAIQAGADAFLTSDLRLRQCREVNVRVLV